MTISPGDNVGPYRIIEPLGQGGMATVFKGYHPALDRYVAIKVLHPAFKEDPNFIARFNREARIVAKLDHPNIVPIYDFAEHAAAGTPYLVMRYVEGKTLKAFLREGALTIPRVLAMTRPVTDALGYAHSQGILHRDIKPSNIIVANDGHIFLTDFGLARIAQASDSTLSQDMLIGTPQYISPEQASGKPASEQSDIYSLGVVLFEMFTGRVPFSADTPYAVIHDHIYTPLPMPTSINPALPPEIERVLLKALAKDAPARYTTAPELMTALEQAAASPLPATVPLHPIVVPAPAPAMKEATPTPSPIPQAIAIVPAPSASTPSAASSAPKPKRRGIGKVIAIGFAVIILGICAVGTFGIANTFLRNARGATPILKPTEISQVIPPADPVANLRARLAAHPNDPRTSAQLGDELVKLKNYGEALVAYDNAIKLNRLDPDFYLRAGDTAQKMGDLNRALKYYEDGFTAAPQTEFLIRQADILLTQKKLDDAQKLYEKVLRTDPDNALAHYGLGRIAKQRGNLDELKRQFMLIQEAKDLPPPITEDVKKQLADLQANAIAQARSKVTTNPQDPNAHIALGDEYANANQVAPAFNEYEQAIKLAPKAPLAYNQAGRLATKTGDVERAIGYFNNGLANNPDDLALLIGLGDALFKAKKYDDARAAYEKALKLKPDNAQTLWRLGELDRAQGKAAEALRNFTRAIALDPNLPEAHYGLGMLALGRGANDEARRQFQMVINNPAAPGDLKDQAQKQLSQLGDK